MKIKKKIAFTALLLSAVLMLSSCTAQREDNGVAYEKNMVISSVADLEGKQVAVQLRSPADDMLTESKVTNYLRRYESMEKAAQDLVDKKLAAIVVDSNYAEYLVSAHKDEIKVLDIEVGTIDYKFVALKNSGNEKMISAFDKRIAALKGTEHMDEIVSSVLVKGEDIAVVKEAVVIEKTVTMLADPYFKPFVYSENNLIKGFFVTVADESAYSFDANLVVEAVEPGKTLEALSEEDFQFAVTSGDVDPEVYTETAPFYTSKLVVVARVEEKKK